MKRVTIQKRVHGRVSDDETLADAEAAERRRQARRRALKAYREQAALYSLMERGDLGLPL
jgi:hypothetical protein